MIGRRGLAAIVLIGACVALAGLVIVRLPQASAEPSSSPGPAASRAPATPRLDELAAQAFPGPALQPGAPVPPAGRPTQSRLWSIDGTWFGSIIDPSTRESRIGILAEDGSRWDDTGVLLDERPGAMIDALWDGRTLLVVSAAPGRSTANGVRIARFGRDDAGRFARDPNFPVPLTERGVSAATVARDGTGRAWVAFVQDRSVYVAHSTTDDARWEAPVRLPGSDAVGEDDLAAVVALGDDRLAVVWSDAPDGAVRLALRADRDPPATWGNPEVTFSGLALGPRPISVAAADGTVAVGIQTTDLPDVPREANDPDSLIAVRDPAGGWRTALTSRVTDRLGSPVVGLDPAAGDVYAFLTSPRRAGVVYLKRASLDRLDFPTGLGLAVIDDPTTPPRVASVTTAKGSRSPEDGIVVQGLDESSGIPWHAVVGRTDGTAGPTATPGATASGATPEPTSKAEVRLLIDDDFAPWAEGDPIGNGWELGPVDGDGTLVAEGGSPGERHAAVRSATDDDVRACKAFPAVTGGEVVVEVAVRADGISDGDVVITSIRSGPAESASVRFGQGGTFAYYAGATKIRTTATNQFDRWLHSRVTVRLGNGTYDWRLTTTDGTVIVAERAIPFREPVDGASSVCIGTSSGPGRPVVRFDDVRVAH